MILTFQTVFHTVDEEEKYADIEVPETRTVDDLFKVVAAETGVAITSPMEIIVNDQKYYRNDTRTLTEAGINEYDTVEVQILKNGGKAIPGNVTVLDLYSALGDRLKKMRLEGAEEKAPVAEVKPEAKPEVKPVEAAPAPAPVAAPAPAPVAAPVTAPAPVKAFALKPAKANAFALKGAAKFSIKK